jgi:uncharacterized protein YjbI with pentapeptide repeats
VVLDGYAGSWFIADSSNTVILSVMVEEKGRQTADKKEGRKPWTLREFGGQTVWDWLHLLSALAIPVVLAAAGLWFTAQQDQRQVAIENQRAEAERELAQQRAQDEALQAYLDQMDNLLLEKNLRESAEDSEVRTLARARTVTLLRRLDSTRNRDILQFLREARLTPSPEIYNPTLGPLGGSKISIVRLDYTDLSEANLRGANLDSFNLRGTDLSGADLRGAYLAWTKLDETNLKGAKLQGANLSGDTSLRNTNLKGASLQGANLSGEVDLSNANLESVNLEGANLEGAEGVTDQQLAAAKSLEGATMPNGQNYEDWLKDKEGNGEDG